MFKAVHNTLKSQVITVTSLCLVVLLMGIFFASQSYSAAVDAISINKMETKESIWKINLDESSYKETEGSNPSTYTKILSNVVINNVTLNNSNEFYEYTIALENIGNIPAVLKNINIDGLNENITTTIKVNTETYDNTKELKIEENCKYYVTIRVEYKEVEYPEPQDLKLVTTFELEQKEKED